MHIRNIRKRIKRFVNFVLYGGFVQRPEGHTDGDMLYRVVSGNRHHHVAMPLFRRLRRKPFLISKRKKLIFTRV